jgi:hypothetical protein
MLPPSLVIVHVDRPLVLLQNLALLVVLPLMALPTIVLPLVLAAAIVLPLQNPMALLVAAALVLMKPNLNRLPVEQEIHVEVLMSNQHAQFVGNPW